MTLFARHPPRLQRLAIWVRGKVQGVGFRPHIAQLAQAKQFTGWVRNEGDGVMIEVQGLSPWLLVEDLKQKLPALASIDQIEVQEQVLRDSESCFQIHASLQNKGQTLFPPDTSVCEDCLAELFDPGSRYYRYPFLNCTRCGPRYTIVRQLPYDRQFTSLHEFVMCADCTDEYHDIHTRRFHAQPTACPVCGPQLSHSIEEVLARLKHGEILAIKGLGGFHLVCDATNRDAVARLRERKQRDAKPFALMVANIETARRFVNVNEIAEKLLVSPLRPVVVLAKSDNSLVSLAEDIAPGLDKLGVMLAYTPLHYLLFHEAAGRPRGTAWLKQAQELMLVMTSANPNGEPIVIDNEEAQQRLANITDGIITHNRDILTPLDDSVVEVMEQVPRLIRRARGYVPEPVQLAFEVPPILAVGAHLKNTVCVTRGDQAFVSQHVGGLDNPATITFFEKTIDRLCDFLQVSPQIIAHDLHPDFISTHYALSRGLQTVAVQHHHAHLAAVMAEHHIDEPVLGLVLDGYGMGDDGHAWGGELFALDGAAYQRLGHLKPLAQPGGEQAAREPWRMAAAVLHQLGLPDLIPVHFAEQRFATQVARLLEQDVHCPVTSSAGRLFDAVSGLLKISFHNRYEAEAAMRLQSLVTKPEVNIDGWRIKDNQLDLSPLLRSLICLDPVSGANLFHGTFIEALCDWVNQEARVQGVSTILLGGGCFLNGILLQGVTAGLRKNGLRVLTSRQVPVNDGGLCLGQVWVAALRHGA